jgi:hypothetical protein
VLIAICGLRLLAVLRGTLTSTEPTSASTVFARVPLRLQPLFFPAESLLIVGQFAAAASQRAVHPIPQSKDA